MLSKILPTELISLIYKTFNINNVCDIKIRKNKPICINEMGEFKTLKSISDGREIFADKRLIDYIIMRATESSLYCYNDQIKQFFISTKNGLRLGLCGEVVIENKEIKTIKNISSISIRLPHEVLNCSKLVLPYIFTGDKVKNTLIISPPGCGKTTLLRDLVRVICSAEKIVNGLVVDERFEISGNTENLNLGNYSDIVMGGTKIEAFNEGIRSLKPDVIFTDEIANNGDDVRAVINAVSSGVSVVATIHGDSFSTLYKRQEINILLKSKIFDYYVFLSNANGVGTVDGLFNSDFKPVWG